MNLYFSFFNLVLLVLIPVFPYGFFIEALIFLAVLYFRYPKSFFIFNRPDQVIFIFTILSISPVIIQFLISGEPLSLYIPQIFGFAKFFIYYLFFRSLSPYLLRCLSYSFALWLIFSFILSILHLSRSPLSELFYTAIGFDSQVISSFTRLRAYGLSSTIHDYALSSVFFIPSISLLASTKSFFSFSRFITWLNVLLSFTLVSILSLISNFLFSRFLLLRSANTFTRIRYKVVFRFFLASIFASILVFFLSITFDTVSSSLITIFGKLGDLFILLSNFGNTNSFELSHSIEGRLSNGWQNAITIWLSSPLIGDISSVVNSNFYSADGGWTESLAQRGIFGTFATIYLCCVLPWALSPTPHLFPKLTSSAPSINYFTISILIAIINIGVFFLQDHSSLYLAFSIAFLSSPKFNT